MNLSDKHIVITGAGSGVGEAVARCLAAEGARLTLLGRRLEAVESVAASLPKAQAFSADVTNQDNLAQALNQAREHYGPISSAIANAGAVESKAFKKMTAADWQACLDVNLTGCFNTFQTCIDDMLEAGEGRLIAVASTAGLRGYPYVSAYVAAKHGVVGLVKALALELATKNITVNAVCPGYTRTPLLQGSMQRIADSTQCSLAEAEAILVKDNPQQRLIEPQEVAQSVLYLLLQNSLNGQALTINGGEF
jgi:NAD(P)-dependent dehydrogenase (short-subunit alcohol dehydrogenase family)